MFTTVELIIMYLIISTIVGGNIIGLDYFIPSSVYKNIKVNWFGAWFITIACHMCFPVLALFYWIKVLLTLGRE